MSGVITLPTTECKVDGGAIATENILETFLHLGCTREVSTFSIIVDNSNPDFNSGDYSPSGAKEFTKGDSVTIKIKRGTISGSTNYLLTGVLEVLEYVDEAEDYQFKNVVILRGRCKGYQLFDRKYDGDLISDVGTGYQAYKRASGEAESLVAYLIDNYTSLTHIREREDGTGNAASGQKVVNVVDGSTFTVGDLVKIYDDLLWEYNKIASIVTNELTMVNNLVYSYTTGNNLAVGLDLIRNSDTTYTKMEFTHETIFDILKWISDTADESGTIGYDSRVEYDGEYAWLPRGKVTESYSLSAQVQLERYIDDATRIKNKIWVYGKADKPFPYDQTVDDGNDYSDHWTEEYSQTKSELASNANSGQKDVVLVAGQGANYSAGDYVWLVQNDYTMEQCQAASIITDTLTMEDNLANSFTTANHAILVLANSTDERGWAQVPTSDDNDIAVGLSVAQTYLGSNSIGAVCNASLITMPILFFMEEGENLNCNEYKELRGAFYFDTTVPEKIFVYLYSGDSRTDNTTTAIARLSLSPSEDEWVPFSIPVGEDNANSWPVIGASFDWTDVKIILFQVIYPSSDTYTFFIDALHFIGKRWGGGDNNAAIDGFAEDTGSQTTYGTKEHIVVNDLLLSDAECEAKAQSLLNFYGNPRITIIPDSKTLDWVDYPLIPGNKVAVNLTPLGISDDYRIDTVDIKLNGEDHELAVEFGIDNTPPRTADYLQGIIDRLRTVEKSLENIKPSSSSGASSYGGSGGTISHASLTGVTANQHHNQLHNTSHILGGTDEIVTIVSRMDKQALTYYDDPWYVCRIHDKSDEICSLLQMGHEYDYGTYQAKIILGSALANNQVVYALGFEKHHGWSNEGIIAFLTGSGSDYWAENSWSSATTSTDISGSENWSVETTVKVVWDASNVYFYTGGVERAHHTTNIPQDGMSWFMEVITGSTAPGKETEVKQKEFEEL